MTVAEAIKARDEYVAKYETELAVYDKQLNRYKVALNEWKESIKRNAKEKLGCEDLTMTIYESFISNGFEIVISNDIYRRRDEIALRWDVSVKISDDGVSFRSNSWSGADFTSMAKVEDLENTVAILKKIHSIDWRTVSNTEHPKYNDYVTVAQPYDETARYDFAIERAKISELVTERKIIKLESGVHCTYFISVIKETDKQYTYTIIASEPGNDHYSEIYDDLHDERHVNYPRREKKEKFFSFIGKKYEVIDC